MPNTILKRWNGTSFEELYPKTTVGQISASGTPNSTTFLRGDGQWATPTGSGVSGSGTTNELAYWNGSTSLGTLAVATYPSLTELSYVKGVTSAIQTQLNGKQATLTNPVTGTGTSNQITYWSGTGTVAALSTATYPSLTELSYVKGVTSALQTQIDGKAPTSHATSATTYGVGTNTNYGHVKGLRLTGASDGESGVVVLSGVAYATKTLRVNGVAQQAWGTLLDLDTSEGNIVRFVDLTITRIEGGITYYIGSIMVDINVIPTNNFTTTPSPTVTSGYRWRLSSHNSSNTQVTLPIFMYRNTVDNALRVYVDQATTATYDYECVGYF